MTARCYGASPVSPRLVEVARVKLGADGIDATNLAVVGGALDGVERVVGAWLRPGDRIAVEDPGYTAAIDLLSALGLELVPVGLDEPRRPARPPGDGAAERGARPCSSPPGPRTPPARPGTGPERAS